VGRHHGVWVIIVSFIVALVLTIVPLPPWANLMRPDWVALVLLYWCLALPERVGVGTGWGVGLLRDALTGMLLGQNALALAVIAYVAIKFHQRIRLFPDPQQALTVLVLLALYQGLILGVDSIIGRAPRSLLYWLPAATGMLLWPLVFLLLRDLRRRFKIT
jgi:rod shape-determining protein MreD